MTNAVRGLQLVGKALIVPLPWPLKRLLLQRLFGYQLHRTARIGLAWIYPCMLRMAAGSRIAALTVAVNLDALELGEQASIGRSNWITGFPTGTASPHFAHQPDRRAELSLGDHAAITKNHHVDCTNRILIGPHTTIAGYHSQLLSHAIDLHYNRQHSEPITIGAYCFVGSSCVILGGSVLPDHCVLGALSLLNKPHTEAWGLYAGQPARRLKNIDPRAAYFSRSTGLVV
ncbi:acyltransferase [Synechococcus sp. HK05]|uniref:acyltransferase n=1 Tax=Synechococcus sp. HK05 TaxID=2725975 RepID=UPI001C38D8E8|nr:acyltransferase [Synechococcus sp. HK05]MBV2350344.1 acyltransferase [Synechococcus sp. HK05]